MSDPKEPTASILAIGTELTNGQIINRNASWISQQLLKHGLLAPLHLAIPDDRALIHQELKHISSMSDLIFVTGGLGPTTDDFTRDCISDWSGKKLVWNQDAWIWIQERFRQRNLQIREFQKQQCYFPEDAEILHNPEGTAHGFYLKVGRQDVFVLPGPPREIEAVWNLHIEKWLAEKYKNLDRALVKSWDCFGVGESEVAHRAEEVMKGASFEKGYRAHLPFVEFKLFYKKSQELQIQPYFEKIERALGEWIVARDGQDTLTPLLESFREIKEIYIQDGVTQGILWDRLSANLKKDRLTERVHFSHSNSAFSQITPASRRLILTLSSLADREIRIEWNLNHQKRSLRTHSPYPSAMMREREKQYFAEKAILFWASLNSLC